MSGACFRTRIFPCVRTQRTRAAVLEQMQHQCVSENNWFRGMLGIDVEVPSHGKRAGFIARYAEVRQAPGSLAPIARLLVGRRSRVLRCSPQPGLDHGPPDLPHLASSRAADGHAPDARPGCLQHLWSDSGYRRSCNLQSMKRSAQAQWRGDLKTGAGAISTASGAGHSVFLQQPIRKRHGNQSGRTAGGGSRRLLYHGGLGAVGRSGPRLRWSEPATITIEKRDDGFAITEKVIWC